MAGYNFDIAKRVLSETDKDRFLCIYLNLADTSSIDWKKAADDFGSASVESLKKMIATALKKVKQGEAAGDGEDGGVEQAAPTKGKGGKKRKGAAATDAEGDGPEDKASPKKKAKKGKKGKSAEKVVEEVGSEGDDAGGVKVETAEES